LTRDPAKKELRPFNHRKENGPAPPWRDNCPPYWSGGGKVCFGQMPFLGQRGASQKFQNCPRKKKAPGEARCRVEGVGALVESKTGGGGEGCYPGTKVSHRVTGGILKQKQGAGSEPLVVLLREPDDRASSGGPD